VARPKKVHFFKIVPFSNAAGSKSWRVTGTMPDGRRIRQNFEDKSEAVQRVADLELEIEGKPDPRRAQRTLLSAEQLADAEAAFQQLPGRSLSKTITHFLTYESRALKKGVDLEHAIAFFETRYRPETKAISILNAKTEFLRTRHGLSDATRANYETGLTLLLKDPNKHLHAFTVDDLEVALSRYKNLRSQRSLRIIFGVFFHWAVRHHYCLDNPCKRLDKLPREISQISILSLEEVKRLLFAAVTLQGGVAAATIAIGLFAGLRPSELAAMKPSDIGETSIKVSGGKLRRKLKRSVPIPPVLAAWLKRYPFKGAPAGWDYKMKVLKKATKAAKWVQDIIRHTSISFQAERDKNEPLTAYNNGTSIKMMDVHYRNNIDDQKTLEDFWELAPERLLAAKPEIKLAQKAQVNWPEKTELKKLVWESPLTQVAEQIGVSDVGLRKRCLLSGIALPPRGHWLKR
jgi:integrase